MTDDLIEPPYFEVLTPLDIRIRTMPSYWEKIVSVKHPHHAWARTPGTANLARPLRNLPQQNGCNGLPLLQT